VTFSQESVRIRAMVEGDVDRVVRIAASLETAPKWARAAYLAAIEADEIPRRIALVAEIADELVGFVVACVLAPQAELESIAVASEAQRRGIGRALLAALIGELKGVGVGELDLEVRESNLGAAILYAGSGFCEVGRRRGYYRDPEEDAVLFRLILQALPISN